MKLRINVTAHDIQQAKLGYRAASKGKGWDVIRMCPLARAVRRHSPMAVVGYSRARIDDVWYPLPNHVMEFIVRFDRRKKVEPFRFTLDLSNK